MVRGILLSAGMAAILGLAALPARADGQDDPVYKDAERERVETLDRDLSRRAVRAHDRYRYKRAVAYRHQPRRHFFVDGVHTSFYGPVAYATVTYRTYVYYTPGYPSMTFGYPPYAYAYGLASGPLYNKPCLC
jgi:hypothetical protein